MTAVLISTVVIFALPRWRLLLSDESSPRLPLGELLPTYLPGARVENLQLGPNEFVDQQAREKLDYDEVVFRAYTTPAGTFTVYIGHWKSGRFSPSFIASHTPDRCWTMAGMTCLGYKSNYALDGGEFSLPGGEWRRFATPNGQVLHVVFWHLVGDRLHDYGGRLHAFTDPVRRVQDVVKDLFVLNGAQYFVRVSSDRPFEDMRMDPAFHEVLRALRMLGIEERRPTGGDGR